MKEIRIAKDLPYLDNIKEVRYYLTAIITFLIFSYSIYFLFDKEFISKLVVEDGFFEYLTAILFFISSIFIFFAYLSKKNIFLLLLSIAMFIGAGEEISWGQRIIGFSTPEAIAEINVQDEFTFHNIHLVNGSTLDKKKKVGIRKVLTINFLYKLFWLGYCVLLPITAMYVEPIMRFSKRIQLPVPPLSIGVFFMINWLVYRMILEYVLLVNEGFEIGEVRECASAFLFMMVSLYFLNAESTARQSKTAAPESITSAAQ